MRKGIGRRREGGREGGQEGRTLDLKLRCHGETARAAADDEDLMLVL